MRVEVQKNDVPKISPSSRFQKITWLVIYAMSSRGKTLINIWQLVTKAVLVFRKEENCRNVYLNCKPGKEIFTWVKRTSHLDISALRNRKHKEFQSIQVFLWFSKVWHLYPVAGCTHHFPSWGSSWQAPQTLTVQGLEFLLSLLATEQFLHVISVQLIFPISLICCPDVVLSYHAVFWKGFPVEIAHRGAPACPLGNEARAM